MSLTSLAGDLVARTRPRIAHTRIGQSHRTLALAGLVGVVTGAGVAAFDWLAAEALLDSVLRAPLVLRAVAPLVGLLVAAAALRWLAGGATPSTADEYIRNFHDHARPMGLRSLPGRALAALATLGSGGALGYEGPALYLGAGIGSAVQRRFSRLFGADDTKVLMAAGAAAGVAAIFKAPVTGLVFALEVPYHEDIARRLLLPAGLAAAAGYVTFAALAGTEPLLPVSGTAPFDLRDLGGAAALGLVCGAAARVAVIGLTRAKRLAGRGHPVARAAVAGLVLAVLFAAGRGLGITNPTLGPGYDTLAWALDDNRTALVLAVLAALRLAATTATLGGGGAGGLFIPLVIQGALLGRIAGGLVEPANPALFPVLGIAAFLGAGYHVPLAAVVFVAEFTGRPGFVVPGLIAAIVAQLPMGTASVSPYQRPFRPGHLERQLALPLAHVLDSSALTVPPDATVTELFHQHLVGTRRRSVAVVDTDDRYLGMAVADDLADLDRSSWATTPVTAIARTDVAPVALDGRVDDALRAMEAAGIDAVAVADRGRYIGVVTVDGIVSLDQVLDRSRTRPA